ncbi:MAG TPA: bifunctional phosphoribosyl-AMP cyclohydrolase/phosphoribosyl-ATP diphosphatase HisIE [Dinghuibacter sp.]|uniref:bifunctional phosphoribosyl-AMP cyclohydrolase/phosphoribosyl-ATP diphosphatase HisIE n=1 Tax=Dinghuibacter sp. TaxID=2024697 RepID=UPI002BC7400A|nr:bifunctional phosphoribosyl-AMP cyclohydrolase/phosphoribosyl-ATP diphosphatase HisIE [Dinghuibacter sp.]HTJ13764.1 bifunctional phosphoribosyl-AMP cyclohydrolase/phosphoribosyl-ATP diphosphatase HisIE [Dinghuibacter sp.]
MHVNFGKYADGLVPAIVQDEDTLRVLMLGFMNEDALAKTRETGKVTFYSRSKQRLWTKGEESGRFLLAGDIRVDCDEDTLLVKARPQGPTCHTGADTCWSEDNVPGDFLTYLEGVIASRKGAAPETSYTAKLLAKGINKVAQKVGEEAVELVIEAKDDDKSLFLNEAADLLFHYLVLLQAKGYSLAEVTDILKERHAK